MHTSLPGDALKVKGSFSWGFVEKKDADDIKKEEAKKKQEKKDKKEGKTTEEKEGVEKPLEDFVPLKSVDISINKGEFVCVIGDVGSGKTSLL